MAAFLLLFCSSMFWRREASGTRLIREKNDERITNERNAEETREDKGKEEKGRGMKTGKKLSPIEFQRDFWCTVTNETGRMWSVTASW
jgi:hypothetical protein